MVIFGDGVAKMDYVLTMGEGEVSNSEFWRKEFGKRKEATSNSMMRTSYSGLCCVVHIYVLGVSHAHFFLEKTKRNDQTAR